MVVKLGQDSEQSSQRIQETPVERDNANLQASSVFVSSHISDTRTADEHRARSEFNSFTNNITPPPHEKAEFGHPTRKFTSDGTQASHIIPVYANMSSISATNDGTVMTDRDRSTIVARRTGSFDLSDGQNSPRNSMKYESEYECMSSPESFSNSSSNRSSNTSSFYGNISPDTLSLASFAGRLNFGRFSTASRSSQSSNASSQDSGRQSWGKIRDSFDLSDAVLCPNRRPSGEHVYENTRPFTPDNFMKFARMEAAHMEVTDHGDTVDEAPPLPTRQNQHAVSSPSKEEPEVILPYKVVDLEELQRSLEDIEPYYIHNRRVSDDDNDDDKDFYNDASDAKAKDTKSREENGELVEDDFRPVLPPKKRPLSHSQSDPYFNTTQSKDKPIPLPRQSLIFSDLTQLHEDGTVQNTQTEESTNPSGHVSRCKSPPSGHGSKPRRSSTSPHKNARPMRSAPPPPPPRSLSPPTRVSSNRPVSEMFPRNQNSKTNSPVALKRSLTVSLLQSPFTRRPVDSINKDKTSNEISAQNSSITPAMLSSGEPVDEKNKDDTTKASKTGAFFKKALSNLKIPGTKKATKKELSISSPTDFTSLYQTKLITDYSNREQKTVSFLATDDNCSEIADSDASAAMCEPATEEAEPNSDECELTTENPEESTEQLSFHPEFTELPVADAHQQDEQFYYNFPILQALVDGTEKMSKPKKPPRSGYLQPSLSQLTKEREEEISQNKLPELGPLPTPPEGSSREETPNASANTTPESDGPTFPATDNNKSAATTPEDHIYTVTTPDSDDQNANNGKVNKPFIKPKPEVPRRPNTLKFKPRVPNRPVFLSNDKPRPIPRSLTLDTATIQKSRKESVDRVNERRHSTPLEETAGISRSCDSLDDDAPSNNYVTDMHLVVLKDILQCWRNMLRKPTISLAGACWEDFEIVESDSQPEVSEGSVSLPVQLRKESTNLDSNNRGGHYIAKIKCSTPRNGNTKSPFDQDYSVCTSVESHENVSRVLAYFRGEIQSSMLGMGENTSPRHTTISISDQVPVQTCAEFVAQSKDTHSKDPLSYERTVSLLMLQCLKGITHIHDSGFTHGNLNLNNLFLIKHDHDFQVLIGNFGKSQPLALERRASALYSKIDDSPTEFSVGHKNDFAAVSEIFTAMLHQDHNGNGTHASKASHSALSEHLRKASERLRDGSASPHQVVRFLQALLWGPFKVGENIVIVSESRMRTWLDRQRCDFIARLAMDEALARTVGKNSRKFSMEDLLLCEYLTAATPNSLVRTEKCWFLIT